MNSNSDGKPEPIDPDIAMRTLDLELMRQRATRQAGGPYRWLRAASLIFLVVVILGALAALYYVFCAGGLDKFRAQSPQSNPTAAPVQANP
jgi:hypothetical protein